LKKCPKCGVEYPDDITLCPADGLALEASDDSLIGQTLAGKYRIDERLSEGGMGKVYRGTHVLMDKTVAIKVLHPSLAADEKIVARFSREARAASRISHPHALSVTDFGEDEGGRVFLVMEYLQGKTLKEIIRQQGPMGLERVVEIIRQVGGALEAAHDQGVIHRDLKSENVMLLNTSGADYARVLDFGIAKIMEPDGGYDAELTAPNLVIGTPQYMSPEQCSQSTTIDSRSDIYSLGIILYELLVGRVPFSGESSTAIMFKHMQEPAPSILEARPDVPPSIGDVVARALAKRPDERYQRVGEMIEDLTIAASISTGRAVPVPSSWAGASLENEPAEVLQDLPDEETIVRPRIQPAVERAPITVRMSPMPSPPVRATFNPWKVLIPSAAGLLVIFGVIYAFTRDSQPAVSPQGSSLAADPNSQPVEPTQPATGKAEEGIPVGATIPNPAPKASENANVEVPPDPNIEASPSPSPAATATANTDQEQQNANANSNRKAPPLPGPSRPVNVNEPPPPPPTPEPTKPPAAEPTASPL
jgi:serine/threonine-protein kinase